MSYARGLPCVTERGTLAVCGWQSPVIVRYDLTAPDVAPVVQQIPDWLDTVDALTLDGVDYIAGAGNTTGLALLVTLGLGGLGGALSIGAAAGQVAICAGALPRTVCVATVILDSLSVATVDVDAMIVVSRRSYVLDHAAPQGVLWVRAAGSNDFDFELVSEATATIDGRRLNFITDTNARGWALAQDNDHGGLAVADVATNQIGTLSETPCYWAPKLRGEFWASADQNLNVSAGTLPATLPALAPIPDAPMPDVSRVVPLPADAFVCGIRFNSAPVPFCNASLGVRCEPDRDLAIIDSTDPTIAREPGAVLSWISDGPGVTTESEIDRVRGNAAYCQTLLVVPDGRPEPLPASITSRLRREDVLGVEIAPDSETVSESAPIIAPCLELQRQTKQADAQLIIDFSISYASHGWRGCVLFAFGRADTAIDSLDPYLARLTSNLPRDAKTGKLLAAQRPLPPVARPPTTPPHTPPAPLPPPPPPLVHPPEEEMPNPTDKLSYADVVAALNSHQQATPDDLGRGVTDCYRLLAEGTSVEDVLANRSNPTQTPQPAVSYADWLHVVRQITGDKGGYARAVLVTFRRFGGEHWPLEYIIEDLIGAAHPNPPFARLF